MFEFLRIWFAIHFVMNTLYGLNKLSWLQCSFLLYRSFRKISFAIHTFIILKDKTNLSCINNGSDSDTDTILCFIEMKIIMRKHFQRISLRWILIFLYFINSKYRIQNILYGIRSCLTGHSSDTRLSFAMLICLTITTGFSLNIGQIIKKLQVVKMWNSFNGPHILLSHLSSLNLSYNFHVNRPRTHLFIM